MSVAIVNQASCASGGTFTASAGSNRLLVWEAVASHGSGSAPSITAATFGGVSMTQIGSTIVNATSRWGAVSFWYIKEASLPSGVQTASATTANADPTILGYMYTLSGVDQTNPIVATGSATTTGGTSTTASSASVENGGIVLAAFSSSEGWSAGETSACSGYTKDLTDQFDFSGIGSGFHKLIVADGSETPAVTTTASQNASLLIASIRQVSAGGTAVRSFLLLGAG